MKHTSEDFMIKALSFIKRANNISTVRGYIKNLSMRQFNTKDVGLLVRSFENMYRAMLYYKTNDLNCKELDPYLKKIKAEINSIENKIEHEEKVRRLEDALSGIGDTSYAGSEPIVFFLCSKHYGPAVDHKQYQGKLYINADWRRIVRKHSTVPEMVEPAIDEFIKRHKILTVQDVTEHDPYIMYRPHCKHFFTGINTSEVLVSRSTAWIRRMHPETVTKSKWVSPRQRYLRNKKLKEKLERL